MKRLSRAVCLVMACALATSLAGRADDRGARGTYEALDAEALRVKTVFAGAYAVAEIFNDDEIHARLYSAGDDFLGEVILSTKEKTLTANFSKRSSGTLSYANTPGLKATKDWANLQVYSLWRDLQTTSSKASALKTLAWQNEVFRPSDVAAKASVGIAERDFGGPRRMIQSVTTEFAFVTAVAKPTPLPRPADREPEVAYSTFSTELKSTNGETIGLIRWFEREKVLAWDFPGLTSGFVDNERLPGGFTFQPELGWSNIQSYAFWKFHSELFLTKDDPGCNGLHWLDDTIFRPCCDEHDRCYERNGCTWRSWWIFGSSWSCIRCNIEVVFCFLTGGGGGGGVGGGGGGGGGGCTRLPGEWCPAECASCTTIYY